MHIVDIVTKCWSLQAIAVINHKAVNITVFSSRENRFI